MIKNIFIAILSLIITIYLTLHIIASVVDSLDYTTIDRMKSPDGKFELVQFISGSEDGQTPYSHYLVISNHPELKKIQDGYIIFSGYCATKIAYKWLDNDNISIFCQGSNRKIIKTLSIKAFGKNIELSNQKLL